MSLDDLAAIDVDPEPDSRAAVPAAQRRAERHASSIEAGRRIGGTVGAAMAGAMLAVGEIYDGPPDEPGDIDADGIEVDLGSSIVRSDPPAV